MRRHRGFTLVEILVALTMFGIVGGMLLQLFGTGLRSARQAADISHAALLARSKLTELQANPRLEAGTLTGEFDDGYRWTAVLSPSEQPFLVAARNLAPLDLALTIHWGETDSAETFRVDSMLLVVQEPFL